MISYSVVAALVAVFSAATAKEVCEQPNGQKLECAFACCNSFEGRDQGFYCCELDKKRIVDRGDATDEVGRPQRFVAYSTTYPIDYTMLLIGLIVSIVLSILCSFFCCLLCNGCWLHRRRNPHMYETVNNDSGFYPICCGFGIPMGTVVFSSHPPQFREADAEYNGSSTGSLPSSKQRVRFNPDGTPRGVLKNNGNHSPTDY